MIYYTLFANECQIKSMSSRDIWVFRCLNRKFPRMRRMTRIFQTSCRQNRDFQGYRMDGILD